MMSKERYPPFSMWRIPPELRKGVNKVALLKLCSDAKLLGLTTTNVRYLDNDRDMFEEHLNSCKGDLLKSVIAFSKEWRKDKVLRRLEAMMIVLNKEKIFILSGTGDVVEPEDGAIASIGSGGTFAISAARALAKHSTLDEEELVRESLMIAGELCIYTNQNIKILKIED